MSTISSIINNDEPEDPQFKLENNDEHNDPIFKEEEKSEISDQSKENSITSSTSTTETETSKVSQETILASFERIKTHFPAARIKKIMQSDDEIGKVAQATPIIVGRALEIFMTNLVEAAIIESKKQGVKRISASHIRAAVENTEQFDFLVDAVEKYPPLKN